MSSKKIDINYLKDINKIDKQYRRIKKIIYK